MAFKRNFLPFIFAALCVSPLSASAQLSVTTVGATDAAQCFENASNDFSKDTQPCNKAIADIATTRKDKRKTLVNRGIIHNRNLDIEAALNDFNQALEEDPNLAEAYLNRGNSWFLAGRLNDALADYKKALARDVSKPWIAWYNIGLVHDARNNEEKARAAYEKALALNPDFTLARAKLAAGD